MRQGHLLSLVRSIHSQDADNRETDPVFLLLLLLLFCSRWDLPPPVFWPPVPKWFSLACLLKHWKDLDPINLKKRTLIFLCTEAWPQYPLGDQEK
jgi:hypothetical protein